MGEPGLLERQGLQLWGVSNTDRAFSLSERDSPEILGARDDEVSEQEGKEEGWSCGPLCVSGWESMC